MRDTNKTGLRNHDIVVPNFFGEGKNLETWQLGWQPENRSETKNSVSKRIFDTYIEVCHFNLIFYYVEDGNFYGIHGENCPRPVFRFRIDPHIYPIYQIEDQDTHNYTANEILYMVPCSENIWDSVRINGKPLEEVIPRSYIVNIS